MTKKNLLDQILTQLRAELDLQTQAAKLAHDEATNEESRAEGKYDTRGQEAAYLAEGQAQLASSIMESISIYQNCEFPDFQSTDPISIGALVEISSTEQSTHFLLGPRAGGLELRDEEGHPIHLITPHSPLGQQLIGKRIGDSVSLPGRNAGVQTITHVR